MSWFTDIAGRAEDLLNKVDQTAATALQKSKQSKDNISYSREEIEKIINPESSYSPSRGLTKQDTKSSKTSLTTTGRASAGPKKKPESDDEKLLQFLNCNESLPPPSKTGKMQLGAPVKKTASNLETSSQKRETKEFVKDPESLPERTVVTESTLTSGEDTKREEIPIGQLTSVPKVISDSSIEKAAEGNLPNPEFQQVQTKQAAETVKKTSKKPDIRTPPLSGNDKAIRELREREKDMSAALEAKDSQLAILKVRLQEADQELQVNRNIVKDLRAENDRIIKEQAQSAAFQNKTVEILQEQLQQKESELNKTKEFSLQNQNELMQKLGKMEEEHQHLVESYSTLQRKWADLNDKSKDLASQLKQSNGNFDALQQEYNDYKQKAQRILQSKEKLILSLKDGHLDTSFDHPESTSILSAEVEEVKQERTSRGSKEKLILSLKDGHLDISSDHPESTSLLSAEVEEVKQERDLLKEELRRCSELAEGLRAELREVEKASQGEAQAAKEGCEVLRRSLEGERQAREEVQLHNAQLKEELQIIREDLTRTKNGFQSRLQDREIEIEKLRRQLTAKSLSTVSQDELESRLHALTENLIQKQTLVEALSTEKNSLVLQRERLEQQLREAQNYSFQQHAYVGINNNETERKAKSVFLDNPFDSALTRRVKRVYGSIDSFSIRLGVFFRRYPIARVFVIIYMLLLHFWVMIVLLTYEPEVHNPGYGATNQQQ
ncbi:hypothetical protein JTE90_026196 [Oedothorax gibbosus]|uniref:Golgin-84 n=1 Tax=Oedothorax gibbosus TaxID=931172 RepID=A0AAV6U0L2_9ARAC|nr:hypothetical protein JTE90_026196 [Oedothorax gibbosus]